MKSKMIIGLTIMMSLISGTCLAQDENEVQARAEFNKHVLQRNKLLRELGQLDQKALAAVKDEKAATKINAQQVAAEDRLDLIQLRMETLAARYGYVIPEPPKIDEQGRIEGDGKYGLDAFKRGRDRTQEQLRLQTLRFLASLDFSQLQSSLTEK